MIGGSNTTAELAADHGGERIIADDRYPLSPRALKEILGQPRAEPEREPLPP